MKDNYIKISVVSIFVGLYILVSLISTIHVIDFFKLSNDTWLAIVLAIAFELGAAASLAAIVILDKTNRLLIWGLFILITSVQMMGNMYYAFVHLSNYSGWIELFDLVDESEIYQKRVLSIISGGILPIVALGFIKSLVDYIRPNNKIIENDNYNIDRDVNVDVVDDGIENFTENKRTSNKLQKEETSKKDKESSKDIKDIYKKDKGLKYGPI